MPGDKERRDFGRRLSEMLLDKEMSMSDLARAVWGETRVDSRGYGAVVGKDRISSYCAGKTLPTALTARKLAKALACDVRDLLPNDAGDVGREGRMRDTVERLRDAARFLNELEDFPELQTEAATEITRLREENARLIRENKVAFEAVGGVVKANDKLKEENARLREALKPFVPETQVMDPDIPDTRPIDVMVRAGELRTARAAILGKVKAEDACPAPDEVP